MAQLKTTFAGLALENLLLSVVRDLLTVLKK